MKGIDTPVDLWLQMNRPHGKEPIDVIVKEMESSTKDPIHLFHLGQLRDEVAWVLASE
jgi:hypothetical protein